MTNIRTNTLPSLLLAKHAGSKFKHQRPAVFAAVSAKVGSIADNRLGGWVSYRASKAALHPGTTDTALSKPFQRHVPAGQLFSPQKSAGYMLEVLDQLNTRDSGKFWAFDGELLPW